MAKTTAVIIPFPSRFDAARRGYQPLYNGAATPCPGCFHTNWYVGRTSAECAFCGTAVPIRS